MYKFPHQVGHLSSLIVNNLAPSSRAPRSIIVTSHSEVILIRFGLPEICLIFFSVRVICTICKFNFIPQVFSVWLIALYYYIMEILGTAKSLLLLLTSVLCM